MDCRAKAIARPTIPSPASAAPTGTPATDSASRTAATTTAKPDQPRPEVDHDLVAAGATDAPLGALADQARDEHADDQDEDAQPDQRQ